MKSKILIVLVILAINSSCSKEEKLMLGEWEIWSEKYCSTGLTTPEGTCDETIYNPDSTVTCIITEDYWGEPINAAYKLDKKHKRVIPLPSSTVGGFYYTYYKDTDVLELVLNGPWVVTWYMKRK